MPWIMIIAALVPLVEMLIKWLRDKKSLSPNQRERLNHVLYKFSEVRGLAVPMGCFANGEPGQMSAAIVDDDEVTPCDTGDAQ